MVESETIQVEEEAKCAADKSEEGGEKGPNLVNPDVVHAPLSGQPAMGRPAWPWLAYR